MARRPVLLALAVAASLLPPAGAPAARDADLSLRLAPDITESPVGGHLAVREVIVDGRSLGWQELVEYLGALYAPKALLDSLGLAPRAGALSVYTRFETWYLLNAIPGLSVYYDFSRRRVSLGTGGRAAVPADAPAAGSGIQLRPARALSSVGAATPEPARSSASAPEAPQGSPTPAAAPTSVLAQAPATRPEAPGKLLPLEVRVNGANVGNWLLLEKDGKLYATPDAFDEWRLSRDTSAQGVPYRNRVWYPLASIPGYQAQYNFAEQSVDLTFQASAFGATRLTGPRASRPPLSPVLPSFFLNYDVSETVSGGRDIETRRDLGALLEFGYSGSLGVLTSSYVGRNLENDENIESRSWRRLETTFTRDYPDQNVSLRLGDSSTRPGMWGRQVYFGGVQIGRNYALSPGFVTYPLPIIAGQSSAPSTVDLYVNDVLRQTSQVPTGPFTIDNFPLLTGSGQARLVVRDLLGRETVLVQDFFASSDLLDEGLSDWSAEVGAVRQNFGIENADYGQTFVSGLWRYGIDRKRTFEARTEIGEETRGAGLGLSVALPWQMLGQVAAAGSRNETAGSGGHAVVGLQHSSLRHGFSIRAEGSSREYRQIGIDAPGLLPPRRQLSASYTSYARQGSGSFGLAYARIERYDQQEIVTTSANYTLRIGARSSLTFTASRVSGAAKADTYGVSLLVPFDNRVSATANVTWREDSTDSYVGVSQGLGADIGVGWRALAGRRAGRNFGEGGVYYQGAKAVLTADANATSDLQTARLGAQGALVVADSSLFATRRLQNSFAVVEVPGYENVGVGLHGAISARTDESGRALVPNLQAYRSNSIRLNPNELPISAEIDSIEQSAVPASRSGVKVKFPVRSGRGALIKIRFEDGQPAPAGATVAIKGDGKEFYVARRGEAFVTGLQPSNVVTLNWNGQACDLKIDLPPGEVDDIARVGPVVCTGVAR